MHAEAALNEQEALELLAFLLASAETSTYEPYFSGPMRLMDAASRLIGYMASGEPEAAEWLLPLRQKVDRGKWQQRDEARPVTPLREAIVELATRLKAGPNSNESGDEGDAYGD